MRIVVIGTGYVGLVSGACFAELGHTVICVDNDPQKLATLQKGEIPIYEAGLDDVVLKNMTAERLVFSPTMADSVPGADVVLIAVGTPSGPDNGSADLCSVLAVAREIARFVTRFTVIVLKSTVPVGVGEEVEKAIRDENPAADVAVVSNPEFLREGSAVRDFMQPDRIVVGIEDERARPVMEALYGPLGRKVPILVTGRRDSELIKYASNAYLAMRISFINEFADLCEAVGADIRRVAQGMGLDKRIGTQFLAAGPGYGGSCFPKDLRALARIAHDAHVPLRLVEATMDVNENRKRTMTDKISRAMGGNIAGKKVAILGLTFKPNTDDMRESPSLTIIPLLQSRGARVAAHDPAGMETAAGMFSGLELAADPYEAARDAHAVVVLTEWDVFRRVDLRKLKMLMLAPVLIDLRNVWQKQKAESLGFSYTGIGQP